MSSSTTTLIAAVLSSCLLAGCATSEYRPKTFPDRSAFARQTVTGSRIARGLDVHGKARSGAPVVTITDEQLQQSQGMLLGEKLGGGVAGGYRR